MADVMDQLVISGCDWLSKIKIDWKGVFLIMAQQD